MHVRRSLLLPGIFLVAACGSSVGVAPPAGGQGALDPSSPDHDMHLRMEAFRHLADSQEANEAAAESAIVWKVPVGNAPVRGPGSAPVTIVEFGDFQCGYCARAARTMAQLGVVYGDAVRFAWRDDPLPFHDRAAAAAELAREARAEKGDAGFWAVHDALLLERADLSDAGIEALSHRLGLDAAAVAASVAQGRHQDGMDDDLELADDVGAEGTPTFFVNGRRLVGAQPFEAFKAIVDEELLHAAEAGRKGVAGAALYESIVAGGRVAPDPPRIDVAVPADAPARGGPNAPVIIQEFADFQCPYCTRAESVLSRVLSRYGAEVRLVWRDLPLPMHANAELAAEAASEAKRQKGNLGFWAMHDKLLATGGQPRALERPALSRYAKELGLDVARFDKALDSRAHAAEVTTDAKAAASVGIQGTPAFIVGGWELDGAQPYVRFRKWIRRALDRAGAPAPVR